MTYMPLTECMHVPASTTSSRTASRANECVYMITYNMQQVTLLSSGNYHHAGAAWPQTIHLLYASTQLSTACRELHDIMVILEGHIHHNILLTRTSGQIQPRCLTTTPVPRMRPRSFFSACAAAKVAQCSRYNIKMDPLHAHGFRRALHFPRATTAAASSHSTPPREQSKRTLCSHHSAEAVRFLCGNRALAIGTGTVGRATFPGASRWCCAGPGPVSAPWCYC